MGGEDMQSLSVVSVGKSLSVSLELHLAAAETAH
jgi:hypothetical protein